MLRVAIWGAGGIGKVHADAFAKHPELCTVTAVINHRIEKAEKFIEENHLTQARAYADFESAIQDGELDVAAICLPPHLHAEAAIQAAGCGVHVLTEKPMANSLEECDRMIRAAEDHHVLLGVICQLRFTTCARRVRKLLKEESFGRFRYALIESLWLRGTHYHDLPWRGTWEKEGGGVFTTQAIHHLDLTQFILGQPESVRASIGNVSHDNTECEDIGNAVLYYPGAQAAVNASLSSPGQSQSLRFYTDTCCLSVPWAPAASRIQDNGYSVDDPVLLDALKEAYESIPAMEVERHEAQILNFLRAVSGEEKLFADARDGRSAVELLTAIYESAATGREVRLPIQPEDPFYTLEGKVSNMPHFHEKTRSVADLGSGKIILA